MFSKITNNPISAKLFGNSSSGAGACKTINNEIPWISIETPKILTFIEAKYLSDIDCQTTYDPYRGNTDIYVTVANVGSPLSTTVVIMSTFLTIESWRVKNEILLS
jgi:hypothetical protein